jgi:hypothetical protein
MFKRLLLLSALCGGLFQVQIARATETENQGVRILPTPGKMAIDADVKDWDLSGGVYVCSDAENLRERLACWFHAMWDNDNLYILARWIDDTPMNNPGSVSGDQGFAGDCLQVRTICFPDAPNYGVPEPLTQRTTHLTCWHDRDGKDVVNIEYGTQFNQGGMKDAKEQGARQAFKKNTDGKGYVQEVSIPWKVLAREGWKPKAGERIVITVEPNFGTETSFRISLKDLFRPGVVPDRVFTFATSTCWALGTLEGKGRIDPQPMRLADGRLFKVSMKQGLPVVDWAGLYKEKKLAGFAPIKFTMPEDGYVSLNIKDADGKVVRQLLTANFLTKGEHAVKWDGLTTMSHRRPGEVVPVGAYTWDGIWHKGLGLRLVGWACNAGQTPFDSPGGNWGGDMASPCTIDSTGDAMILGWGASEAGRAAVCTDLDGKVRWRHKRGGFGGAALVTADDNVVFVYDQGQGNALYRLSLDKGDFKLWDGSTESTTEVGNWLDGVSHANLSGMVARHGKLYLSFGSRSASGISHNNVNMFAVADAKTGKVLKSFKMEDPGQIAYASDTKVYVTSKGGKVLVVDPMTGDQKTFLDLPAVHGLAVDAAGNLYAGVQDPDNQVKVFDPSGKLLRAIGKQGGRSLLGKWDPSGVRFAEGIHVDSKNHLWVAENDSSPRRISVWNAEDGKFVKELFGPTDYGAGGGAICPTDPYTMVGHGCEWKLDEKSGLAACVAVFHRDHIASARFGLGKDNRVYLATSADVFHRCTTFIYERVSPGVWKLRTKLMPMNKDGKPVDDIDPSKDKVTGLAVWADANDDQTLQPDELKSYPAEWGGNWINGWYLPMTQSMIHYGTQLPLAPTGWTACGAPIYDPTAARKTAGPENLSRGGMGAQLGMGSEDGRFMVYNGAYGEVHSDFECFDIKSGKLKWTYPSNYTGIHGGHLAPPPEVGLIRAAYDIVGTAKLPEPVGNIFVISTDKGEWHILNEQGFYISSLFQSDPLKIQWPSPAIPGAIMDNVPPGMGAEDFGGSIIATKDGQLYVQAGKTAFINMKVIGLDTVKKLGHGDLKVAAAEIPLAQKFRNDLAQLEAGEKLVSVPNKTVTFTGDAAKDFGPDGNVLFSKNDAKISASVSHDDTKLYLAWTMDDATPWLNGATDPVSMYAKGDTVDFQLAVDPNADPKRTEAAMGDLRLSIGNFQGKPTAVLYRPISSEKHPKTFFSGTAKEGWEVQSVEVLSDVEIKVAIDAPNRRYVVEAAVPLSRLNVKLSPKLTLLGDFGATYGAAVGDKTAMRSYWSNQATDFVADEVWELKLSPNNWGKLLFE